MGGTTCQKIGTLPANMTSTGSRPGINKKFTTQRRRLSEPRLEALEEERIPDPQHRGDWQTLGKPGDKPLRANGHQIHIQPQQLLAFQSCQLGEKS